LRRDQVTIARYFAACAVITAWIYHQQYLASEVLQA
jgi:hypothetical protein